MNIWDIAVLATVAAAVILAVVIIVKDRKNGKGCGGRCDNCRNKCK